ADEVEVDELVPGFERGILGGGSPDRARVVDEDVEGAELCQHLVEGRGQCCALADVAGERVRGDALLAEMLDRVLELVLLARRERGRRPHLAPRLGDLPLNAARAAGKQ